MKDDDVGDDNDSDGNGVNEGENRVHYIMVV